MSIEQFPPPKLSLAQHGIMRQALWFAGYHQRQFDRAYEQQPLNADNRSNPPKRET